MNTVDIFHSLAAEPNYITLLFKAIEIMMDFGLDLHVIHVPGSQNIIADALS